MKLYYNVCRRATSLLGSIGLCGRVEWELKTQKMGVVSFVQWTAIISIFLSASKCGSICRAETCAHSGIEPSRSAKAILQGGPKVRKNFEFFTISTLYVHISQKWLKIEAYKQIWKKGLSLPYPTVACVWTHRSRGSTGWAKIEWRNTSIADYARATEPSYTISVFLSIVSCRRACRPQTCAHSAIEPSALAKGFLQGGPKTFQKIQIFEHFENLRPYILATVTTRGKSGKNPSTSPIHLLHLYRRISHSVLQAGSKS